MQPFVIPAQAGIQCLSRVDVAAWDQFRPFGSKKDEQRHWIPACAGMTSKTLDSRLRGNDIKDTGFPPSRE
jgi:hypothetical protein